MSETYSYNELKTMNKGYPWEGKIIFTDNNDKLLYKLYASGDSDMFGRFYIAIPDNIKITPEDKLKYNII